MDKRLDKALFQRFNFFHPEKSLRESLMGFGFEVNNGWFNIIWDLCEGIEKELEKHPEMKGVKYKWYEKPFVFIKSLLFEIKIELRNQLKGNYRKNPQFKKLRKQYAFKNMIPKWKEHPFEVIQVKEKFGGLRFYTNFETEEISKLIENAEDKSYITCEECGKPGQLRKGGWLLTLCNEHSEGREVFKNEKDMG